MAHSEEADVWGGFNEAVERTEAGLEQARDNYDAIRHIGDPLSEVYGTALAELSEEADEFDSVYNVTDSEVEWAESTAARAKFLSTVTAAYRRFYETRINQRVELLNEWFDILSANVGEADAAVPFNQSSAEQQLAALRKLTEAGKYVQLCKSDQVDVAAAEANVRQFHTEVRKSLSTAEYVSFALGFVESLRDYYTENLSEMVGAGVKQEAISVTERVQEAPATDPIADRLKQGTVSAEDASEIQIVIETYVDVVLLTGERCAKYELGKALLSAIEESNFSDNTTEVAVDLQARVESLELEAIEARVRSLVESEATTSESERILQLLREHDRSVRRTIEVVDQSPDEVFDILYQLYTDKEIQDLEVKFK